MTEGRKWHPKCTTVLLSCGRLDGHSKVLWEEVLGRHTVHHYHVNGTSIPCKWSIYQSIFEAVWPQIQYWAEDNLELMILLPLPNTPLPNSGFTGHTALVYVMLGMEPRNSCILDKHSTNWATEFQDYSLTKILRKYLQNEKKKNQRSVDATLKTWAKRKVNFTKNKVHSFQGILTRIKLCNQYLHPVKILP